MIPILALSDINYSYHELSGETKALENISFTVNPGEFIAIVGPSGCGKSTLLSLIAGLLVPGFGSLTLNGSPISSVKSKIGYMLQKDHLFEWRSSTQSQRWRHRNHHLVCRDGVRGGKIIRAECNLP